MQLIAWVCSGLLIGSIAGPVLAADGPAAGAGSFEAIASGTYPVASDGFGGRPFDLAGRAGERAAAAASAASAPAPLPGLISIVPEPRPYQLLLGGIGAVFYMARRQWAR